ncbi:Thiamine-monophosphate kinase [Tepidimonas alkaliphilus]|uniref:Thiamine-monophosphate kinase n=1 Tax=Tepidimonas alkaliphilus TaxID=2588942 RepID=A0A554WBT4_9BURK|nr:thiamine-phosphate kinase [Tepidimonas alkaliphilus]TSE21040.1 Thiamine-monophosphate kinase [Tepidimonas alkaliphilus]
MGEFELIRRVFWRATGATPGVWLGNGDDAALLASSPGCVLAVSSDMLVQGRHFLPDVEPQALGHKALAVNLSDLAAMGARPLAFTLALALPRVDEAWLRALAEGMLTLADAHGCALVGGDTTAGPLTLALTVFGEVAPQRALRRDAARVGDDVWVSGALGLARLGLALLRGELAMSGAQAEAARAQLLRPTPRVALGQALAGLAHAAADVSDGLLADLGHILASSGVAAELDVEALLREATPPAVRDLPPALALSFVLAGGDDYELVFTAPAARRDAVQAAAARAATPVACIGRIVPGEPAEHPLADGAGRVRLLDTQGRPYPLPEGVRLAGFDHFATIAA